MLDAGGVPIPEPQGGNNAPGVETTQPHRVVIASEEQFKMFMLPTLKPCGKYKLTAHEGSRVRKVGFVTFPSKVRLQSSNDKSGFNFVLTIFIQKGKCSPFS